MKVKELITKLQEFDGELQVVALWDMNFWPIREIQITTTNKEEFGSEDKEPVEVLCIDVS